MDEPIDDMPVRPGRRNAPRHEPTPEQITAECERVRSSWDPRTEAMRIADDRYQHEALQRIGEAPVQFPRFRAPVGFE